jgi:hypothetical protein
MQTKALQLKDILANGDGERELCKFLKANPFVLIESLGFLGTPERVIAEFPLGNNYVADFVVVAPFSGSMEVRFIEIEPPNERFFTREGTLARRANKALEQINSWRTYIEKNRQQFMRDLENYARDRDLVQSHDQDDKLMCSAGLEIHHPCMTFFFSFEIVMGRRDSLSREHLEKKAAFSQHNGVHLTSCDRLLDGAAKIDLHPEFYP